MLRLRGGAGAQAGAQAREREGGQGGVVQPGGGAARAQPQARLLRDDPLGQDLVRPAVGHRLERLRGQVVEIMNENVRHLLSAINMSCDCSRHQMKFPVAWLEWRDNEKRFSLCKDSK